jgi:hypothetical protein
MEEVICFLKMEAARSREFTLLMKNSGHYKAARNHAKTRIQFERAISILEKAENKK